ncbi:hypothetical protein Tco_0708778 [Tanacetum coccineum]
MTENLKLLINFVWKFIGTVRFGNDHVATILGYGSLQWGNILIAQVYFIEGLGHNLFSVGQFCDSDLKSIQLTDNKDRGDEKSMYDDYIGGQPLNAPRTVPAAPATQNLQTPNASTTTVDSAPTLINSSSQALDIPNTSQDVHELQQQ